MLCGLRITYMSYVLVVVMPKGGLATRALHSLLWVWHRLENVTLLPSQVIFCIRCHTNRGISGAPPANNSFGMTRTRILRHIFSWHSSHVVHIPDPQNCIGGDFQSKSSSITTNTLFLNEQYSSHKNLFPICYIWNNYFKVWLTR